MLVAVRRCSVCVVCCLMIGVWCSLSFFVVVMCLLFAVARCLVCCCSLGLVGCLFAVCCLLVVLCFMFVGCIVCCLLVCVFGVWWLVFAGLVLW